MTLNSLETNQIIFFPLVTQTGIITPSKLWAGLVLVYLILKLAIKEKWDLFERELPSKKEQHSNMQHNKCNNTILLLENVGCSHCKVQYV